MADTVTVTQGNAHGGFSYRLAALGNGESFILSSVDLSSGLGSDDLIVNVCSLTREATSVLDYAVLSIHVDDGIQQSTCVTPSPTTARPSFLPSDGPTAAPSVSPQPSISSAPSIEPIAPPPPLPRERLVDTIPRGIRQFPSDPMTGLFCILILASVVMLVVECTMLWCGVFCCWLSCAVRHCVVYETTNDWETAVDLEAHPKFTIVV